MIEPGGILFLSNALGVLLFVLIAIVWVAGLYDVIVKRSDLDRAKRLGWILLIVILPIVGTVLYFALRPTPADEAERIIATRTGRPYN